MILLILGSFFSLFILDLSGQVNLQSQYIPNFSNRVQSLSYLFLSLYFLDTRHSLAGFVFFREGKEEKI